REALPNYYLKWAYFAAWHHYRAEYQTKEARDAIAGNVAEMTKSMVPAAALTSPDGKEHYAFDLLQFIPKERRREWLDRLAEITERQFPPDNEHQVSDFWLHEIILYTRPSEGPTFINFEMSQARGRNKDKNFHQWRQAWFDDREDDDYKDEVKRFCDFEE